MARIASMKVPISSLATAADFRESARATFRFKAQTARAAISVERRRDDAPRRREARRLLIYAQSAVLVTCKMADATSPNLTASRAIGELPLDAMLRLARGASATKERDAMTPSAGRREAAADD